MKNIKSEVFFGNENFEKLMDELIENKINEVTYRLKRVKKVRYNKDENYPSNDTKVDEIR